MFEDPYGGEPEAEDVLPSVQHCTSGHMEEVALAVPASASSFQKGCMPVNATCPDTSTLFRSLDGDDDPYWEAKLGCGPTHPVTLVVVHAGHEDAGCGVEPLRNIEVHLLDEKRAVQWASPEMSVSREGQGDNKRLMVFAPGVACSFVRVRRRGGSNAPLSLRAVQTFVMPASKYSLSRTILTIDKYAVPQPFRLQELATNAAYKNLYTSSACREMNAQESFAEERVQEAINLAHHLGETWDAEKCVFDHGPHLRTVKHILLTIMENVKSLLAMEPRALVDIKAPCYVFGDIHGNFQDLYYYTSNLIAFRHIKYCAHTFVFLGDYVDRGPHDVECLAYLLSLKLQAPDKVILLRGNHEDRRQNFHLAESFYNHCVKLFGAQDGVEVWEKANELFEYFPVCGVINSRIFCCHGGVPQVPRNAAGKGMRIRDVLDHVSLPIELTGDSDDAYLQTCTDLLWADPAKDVEQFKANEARGCSCVYGQAALEVCTSK